MPASAAIRAAASFVAAPPGADAGVRLGHDHLGQRVAGRPRTGCGRRRAPPAAACRARPRRRAARAGPRGSAGRRARPGGRCRRSGSRGSPPCRSRSRSAGSGGTAASRAPAPRSCGASGCRCRSRVSSTWPAVMPNRSSRSWYRLISRLCPTAAAACCTSEVRGPLLEAQVGHTGRDRAGRHEHDRRAARVRRGQRVDQRAELGGPVAADRRRADLHDDASGVLDRCLRRRSGHESTSRVVFSARRSSSRSSLARRTSRPSALLVAHAALLGAAAAAAR